MTDHSSYESRHNLCLEAVTAERNTGQCLAKMIGCNSSNDTEYVVSFTVKLLRALSQLSGEKDR